MWNNGLTFFFWFYRDGVSIGSRCAVVVIVVCCMSCCRSSSSSSPALMMVQLRWVCHSPAFYHTNLQWQPTACFSKFSGVIGGSENVPYRVWWVFSSSSDLDREDV